MRYDRDFRKQAKKLNMGLITLSWTNSKGVTVTHQAVAKETDIDIVKKAINEIFGAK